MKNGPGICLARSTRCLDCSVLPGQFHEFTVSRSGRDSLPRYRGMPMLHPSRTETGQVCTEMQLAHYQFLLHSLPRRTTKPSS